MVGPRSLDEDAADEDAATDPGTDPDESDAPITHSDIVEDSDTMVDSGIPFWAVDPETERVRLPLPPDAFRPGTNTPGPVLTRDWDNGGKGAEERAVTFFDRGIALQAQHRYAEALAEWEKALELAPEDPFYQASVKRLRAQLRSRER
jgi:tetratricopeptide (TPR) repeat protein